LVRNVGQKLENFPRGVIPNFKKPFDVKRSSDSKYAIFMSPAREAHESSVFIHQMSFKIVGFHENPCWSFFRANPSHSTNRKDGFPRPRRHYETGYKSEIISSFQLLPKYAG